MDRSREKFFSMKRFFSLARFYIYLLSGLQFLATPASGAEAQFKDLSNELSELLLGKEQVCPAISIATVHSSEIVSIGSAGVRKRGSKEKVEIDDNFHLGSCTKSMTAVLGAILVKEGVLDWETEVGDVLDGIEIHSGYQAATFVQLLSNTAGCPKKVPARLWSSLWKMDPDPLKQRKRLVEGILKNPPRFAPGSSYEYSNAGFSIAGHMMEKLTGVVFEELIAEKLFEPLGMQSVGFGPPASKGMIDQPYGHKVKLKKLRPVNPYPGGDNPVAIAPAGRVHCSIEDFARFVRFLLNGDTNIDLNDDERRFLFKPESFDGKYAKGIVVTKRGWVGGNVYMHTGSNTMFYSVMWIAPEIDFAIVAACNSGEKEAYQFMDSIVWKYIQDFIKK